MLEYLPRFDLSRGGVVCESLLIPEMMSQKIFILLDFILQFLISGLDIGLGALGLDREMRES